VLAHGGLAGTEDAGGVCIAFPLRDPEQHLCLTRRETQ
jgi:heme A synthase